MGKLLRRGWAAFLGAVFLCVALHAAADSDAKSSRVPLPHATDAKGDKCVRDVDYMRHNHMKLLLHQRDETVHQGIRTTQYSLKNCIECHASQKNNSVVGSNDNFCQTCHNYVGVKLDCFECHATKPKGAAADTLHPIVPPAAHGGKAQSGLADKMRWRAPPSLSSISKDKGIQ